MKHTEALLEFRDGDAFLGLIDEKLSRRNQKLRAKLIAWAGLLDAAGWCVVLDMPGDDCAWLSPLAEQRFKAGTKWMDLLMIVEREVPAGFRRIGEAILIWHGETQDTDLPSDARLTRREKDVFAWLVEGKTGYEISVILGCAPRTTDKHLANLYRKLGVTGRAQALLKRPPNLG